MARSHSHSLLFDEFDIKDHSTIDYLKRGKKAFQSRVIHNVELKETMLTATYIRGNVTRKLCIKRTDTGLIGTIDTVPTHPFTSPLTALAYWYIQYSDQSKKAAIDIPSDTDTLEPFDQLQPTFMYDPTHNKVNLTLYQPKTQTMCDESYLFVHRFSQLIQAFDPATKTILHTLAQHFDDTLFYGKTWVKVDAFLSNHLMLLIKNNVLFNENHQKITWNTTPIHLQATCQITRHQVMASFDWITEKPRTAMPVHTAFQCPRGHYIIDNTTGYKITHPIHAKMAMQFKHSAFQRLDISKVTPFVDQMVTLRKKAGIKLAIDPNIQHLRSVETVPKAMIDIAPSDTGGTLTIHYDYQGILIQKSDPAPYLIFDDFTYSPRDTATEQTIREALLRYHPTHTDDATMTFESPHFDHVVGDIQYQQLDGVLATLAAQKKAIKHPDLIRPTLQFKTAGTHQLGLQLKWQHPNKPSLTTALTGHIRGGIPYYYDRKKQSIMAIEHTDILNDLSQNDDVTIPVGVAIFMALNTSFDIDLPQALVPTVAALKPKTTPPLGRMARPLRPFQKDGLKWLLSLHNTPFNGILADDMGLGKTIQSIFLLKKLALSTPHVTLIIMPKTLLFNWKKELATFAPELSVLLYDGPKRRELIPQFMSHNVILASYSAIRLDVNGIKDHVFDYLILDEAQYIKNRTTNTFKAIKKIQAQHRLLLTGTPIENHIGDIWSLMDMANPQYFGPFKSFDAFYSHPQHQSILKAAIHPFMLRRRKRDVLTDLPAITTQELWASPSKDELSAYTRLVQKEWHAIESIVQKKGIEKSKVHIFALITKLRQWCAHPALIVPDHGPGPKWTVFFERLQEAINTDHKVVVFSQFIPMIQTIESALTEHEIPFVSLTGQTSDREQVVETFNQDPTIRVGIFSLKAGGVGINLTSADYVFMYDPWWNPAVEQQAIDRVHRMGQDRPVMVFKCLVAGTIEERMITYQEKKRGLIESLVENNTLNDMNLNDIKALIGL